MLDPHAWLLVALVLVLVLVLGGLCLLLERWMQAREARDAERMFPDLRWRNDK